MGFAEFMQGVRADVAHRHQQRATSTGRADTKPTRSIRRADSCEPTAVEAEPPIFAIRLRPLSAARALWANAAGASSRLAMDAQGRRVEFVTEPKTGLKLPGKEDAIPAASPELYSFSLKKPFSLQTKK
jgi:hypothetical protein